MGGYYESCCLRPKNMTATLVCMPGSPDGHCKSAGRHCKCVPFPVAKLASSSQSFSVWMVLSPHNKTHMACITRLEQVQGKQPQPNSLYTIRRFTIFTSGIVRQGPLAPGQVSHAAMLIDIYNLPQTNKQKFKVRQPQRAARSKRPNTPSDGSKNNGIHTTKQEEYPSRHPTTDTANKSPAGD